MLIKFVRESKDRSRHDIQAAVAADTLLSVYARAEDSDTVLLTAPNMRSIGKRGGSEASRETYVARIHTASDIHLLRHGGADE